MSRWMPVGIAATLVLALAVASGPGQTGAAADTSSAEMRGNDPAGGPRPGIATTPTPVVDDAGRLWVAWVEAGGVRVARSDDRGGSFLPAVPVNPTPEDIDANGEARPSMVVAGDEVFVAWTRKGTEPYTGDIRFAVSRDGGRSFQPPVTVNDDGLATGHRFQSMARLADGRLLLAWIDKRDMERAREAGRPYDGAALYATVSDDGGRTFAPNRKLKDHVCECCRLALTVAPAGAPAILFRDIFPGSVRDHALVRLSPSLEPIGLERVTRDGWQIQACPHHGPSLGIAGDGTLHMAWFTGQSSSGPGQFYARSRDGGRTFSAPYRLGTEDSLGHSDILVDGPGVHIAWKDRDAAGDLVVRLTHSRDGGVTWAPGRDVLRGSGSTDHPQLLSDDGRALLAWFTSAEGLRIVEID